MSKRNLSQIGYYHVYNRGFVGMKIFITNRDCTRFINKFERLKAEYNIKIYSYALMDNHFHFLIYKAKPDNLEKFMQLLEQSHAVYFNIKYSRRGPVFDSRYKAKPVTKLQYYKTIKRYIISNPIERVLKIVTERDSLINSSARVW